jgi:hypothetical protein
MIPALLIKISRRVSWRLKVDAASAIEEKDVKSSGRWTISQALGTEFLMSVIASRALEAVRAVRYMRAGLWAAR